MSNLGLSLGCSISLDDENSLCFPFLFLVLAVYVNKNSHIYSTNIAINYEYFKFIVKIFSLRLSICYFY